MAEKDIHVEQKVMRRIKDGSITPRSRYVFVARKLGLGGGLGLSVVLAIFSLSLAVFLLQEIGGIELIFFGGSGLFAFLESFPYLWVVIGVIAFVAASWLLTRYDFSYKRPFLWFLLALIGVVVIGSIGLDIVGTHEHLRVLSHGKGSPILARLYSAHAGKWAHMIAGQIQSIDWETRKIYLELPDETIVAVQVGDDISFPGAGVLQPGAGLRVIGSWQDGCFSAEAVRPWHRDQRWLQQEHPNNQR